MPDGDRIHKQVALRYQNLYQQVCEGYFDDETLAHTALRMIKRDVQAQHDASIHFLNRVANLLEDVSVSPNRAAALQETYGIVEKYAQNLPVWKRTKEILVRASKQVVVALENEQPVHNVAKYLNQRYMLTLYDANFAHCVPLTQTHHNHVPHELVQDRLRGMRPHVVKGTEFMGGYLAGRDSAKGLRLPARSQKETLDLNTDVLSFLKRTEA